jgi:hypothetical protein
LFKRFLQNLIQKFAKWQPVIKVPLPKLIPKPTRSASKSIQVQTDIPVEPIKAPAMPTKPMVSVEPLLLGVEEATEFL